MLARAAAGAVLAAILAAAPAPRPAPGPAPPAERRPPTVEELGGDWSVRTTKHYRILVQEGTDLAADRIGRSLERQAGFFLDTFREPFGLKRPAEPLTAVVFRDEESFATHCGRVTDHARLIPGGFYQPSTRTLFAYDLKTEEEAEKRLRTLDALPDNGKAGRTTYTVKMGGRSYTPAEARAVLTREAEDRNRLVLAHEATHQLARGCGLLPPSAVEPLWLSEGMACYFESAPLAAFEPFPAGGPENAMRAPGAARAVSGSAGRLGRIDFIVGCRLANPMDGTMPEQELETFYGAAWGLFHYLMHGEGGRRREGLFSYIRAFQGGSAAAEVLEGARAAAAAPAPGGGPRVAADAEIARGLKAMFERHVGPIAEIEPGWRRHVASLAAPKKPPPKPPGKPRDKEKSKS